MPIEMQKEFKLVVNKDKLPKIGHHLTRGFDEQSNYDLVLYW